ncbi:tetratricopeptide repeat protein [bacterium CPR1]|nr:tetratricopeptide repeat protein [bacterium CPR1]
MELLEQALSLKNDLREAWINRAACLRHLGRTSESVDSCDRALRLGQCSPAWNELGMALGKLSDARAEDCFRRALECDPHDPLVWNNLGLYRAGSGRLTEARECFTRAIELAPGRADLWIGRGMTFFNLGRLEEASGCFKECLARDERNAAAWEYLGSCLWESGNREGAQPHFERAIEFAPRRASAWLHLGRCYVARRLYEEALPLLEHALELDASQQLGWYVIGSALIMLGRYADSVPVLDRAVELDPGDGDAWFNRGQALLQLKRKQEARYSFEQAHAARPECRCGKSSRSPGSVGCQTLTVIGERPGRLREVGLGQRGLEPRSQPPCGGGGRGPRPPPPQWVVNCGRTSRHVGRGAAGKPGQGGFPLRSWLARFRAWTFQTWNARECRRSV